MAYKLTEENYSEMIESFNGPIVIDFYADWCGPCKVLTKTIDDLATNYVDSAFVCSCNVEESPNLADKYNIKNLPTVVFIKDNEVKDKLVGLSPYNTYSTKIDNLLTE